MKTKTKHVIRINLACRLVVAPALLIAPFVGIERAAAACDPPSPVNGADVTCKGTTGSPSTPVGYGTDTDTGNTINVLSGASVTGSVNGLRFNDGTVNNSGTISAPADQGVAIRGQDSATVTNSGTISTGVSGVGILANTAILINSGTISVGTSGAVGIFANTTATVTNFSSGRILAGVGGTGIFAGTTATVGNFGTISAGAGPGGVGIFSNGTATVSNFSSGTISGGIGILAVGPSTITNSGTIIGIDGTAIALGSNADTLTLLPGSRILGAIDMGGGNDVVNFVSGGGVAQLVTLNNFTGTINTSGVGPVVHNANQIATLDPTSGRPIAP
jgi:hypothetical protein